ncbi:hypothetical protein HPB49_005204 [Dermacentor silvarum]|uniref:Uncharacterized protein n=1 Tax=Dermacentor silvarum TaxID=543639 RepID=A0ACB8DUY8_DERSI|nr:hypothetical protein HPB49_005204 [Dermacentor silvarum]
MSEQSLAMQWLRSLIFLRRAGCLFVQALDCSSEEQQKKRKRKKKAITPGSPDRSPSSGKGTGCGAQSEELGGAAGAGTTPYGERAYAGRRASLDCPASRSARARRPMDGRVFTTSNASLRLHVTTECVVVSRASLYLSSCSQLLKKRPRVGGRRIAASREPALNARLGEAGRGPRLPSVGRYASLVADRMPGDGGSQLEAQLNKSETVHYFCERRTNDYFDLWVNLELMVPYVLDCWVDNMRLVYDNKTRTTRPPDGVHIRVPGFGNTTTVEWLDPSQVSPTAYFTRIVEELVAHGYQRGIDVLGAPYDFRKAPSTCTAYKFAWAYEAVLQEPRSQRHIDTLFMDIMRGMSEILGT